MLIVAASQLLGSPIERVSRTRNRPKQVTLSVDYPNKKRWLRRVLWFLLLSPVCGAVLVLAVFLVGTQIEKRAWVRCKGELEAKGADFNWNHLVPPAVPDRENFYTAPHMAEWFAGRGPTTFSTRVDITNWLNVSRVGVPSIVTASNYLAWSETFEPEFDEIRKALKRPYARMDADYLGFTNQVHPNFVTIEAVAKTLARRAKYELQLGEPERALEELELIHEFGKLLGADSSSRPTDFVAAMTYVEVERILVGTVAEGIRLHSWNEPQLRALQDQLQETDLLVPAVSGLRTDQSRQYRLIEELLAGRPKDLSKIFPGGSQDQQERRAVGIRLVPRALIYRNLCTIGAFDQEWLDCIDLKDHRIMGAQLDSVSERWEYSCRHWTWRNVIGAIMVPDFIRAWHRLALDQTDVNEALVACALERYHLANGRYPEKLQNLTPQFLAALPHDLIGGEPLIYRAAGADDYVLYSVGWNAKDDGGQIILDKYGDVDLAQGDWVWAGAERDPAKNPRRAGGPLVAAP